MSKKIFVDSTNIKFYPTAYRGNVDITKDEKTVTYGFNPESKLNTEENLTRNYKVLITTEFADTDKVNYKNKGDFVVSTNINHINGKPGDPTNYNFIPFEFIIDGYYVKILDQYAFFKDLINDNWDSGIVPEIYAYIYLQDKGAKEPTATSSTPSLYDTNNIFIVNKAVSSMQEMTTTGGTSQNLNDDSLANTVTNNTSLDIVNSEDQSKFTGIYFSTYNPNTSDNETYHVFKILEKVEDEWQIPSEAKMLISLENIYGGEGTLNAKDKIVTKDEEIKNTLVVHKGAVFSKDLNPVEITNEGKVNINNDTTIKNGVFKIKNASNTITFKVDSEVNTKLPIVGSEGLSITGGATISSGIVTIGSFANPYPLPREDYAVVADNSGNLKAVNLETPTIEEAPPAIKFIQSIEQTPFGKISAKNATIPTAASNQLGVVKSATTGTTSGRNYNVEVNNDGTMKVNVPWTDTTYNSGSNITIDSSRKINLNPTVTITGQMKAQTFYATSDARLKENIKPFEYRESILDLPIYTYDFKQGDKNQVGCLAQDLQKLYPELVNESASGYLSINESKLVYLLMEEVKQLKAEIEELKKNK